MLVLFSTKFVSQSVGGKLHIVIRDDFVFIDALLESTTLYETFRQVAPFAHLIRIHRFPICHVHSIVIEDFSSPQVTFSDRANLYHRPSQWLCKTITEKGYSSDRIRC